MVTIVSSANSLVTAAHKTTRNIRPIRQNYKKYADINQNRLLGTENFAHCNFPRKWGTLGVRGLIRQHSAFRQDHCSV